MWILTRSDTNQAVQPQEMARGWKFLIKDVEVLYYPSSKNKGADQLHGYLIAGASDYPRTPQDTTGHPRTVPVYLKLLTFIIFSMLKSLFFMMKCFI